MAQINDYPLTIDIGERRIIRDVQSNVPISVRSMVQGDKLRLLIRAVQQHPRVAFDPTKLWVDVALPSQCYAGIVLPGGRTTAGTFKVTFGADTTSELAYNITAANLATALNALASVTSAGGVTVTGEDGGPWYITFVSNGARDPFSVDGDELYPRAQGNIYEDQAGAADVQEIQVISLELLPLALCSTFTDFPAASLSVEELQEGATGVPAIQRVSINGDAYGGTFILEFDGEATAAIPFDSTAATVQTYLEALTAIGADNVVVTGEFPAWTINFQGDLTGDQPVITGSATGLVVPIGKAGVLDLSVAGIEALVSGAESGAATLEVVAMYDGSSPATIFQGDITIYNDGIPSSPGVPAALPSYLTETASDGRYVRYDTTQTLDSGEKAQAGTNLGLGTFAYISSITSSDIGTGAITTAKIADANVTTAKIADLNVTTGKLADAAVTTAKITDANVTAAKLASDSVTTAKILDANVTTGKLADGAVTAAKLADGTITSAKLTSVVTAATAEVYTVTYDAQGRITATTTPTKANYAPSSPTGVSATTADFDILTLAIPANKLKAGDTIYVHMHGQTVNGTTASSFLTWLKVEGTKSTVVTHAMGTTGATASWSLVGIITVVSIGGSGVLRGSFSTQWKATAGSSVSSSWTVNTAADIEIIVGANVTVAAATQIIGHHGEIKLN